MAFEISGLSDLASTHFDDVIDVRSPSEYAEDHVPGAINLPVLNDEERATVGTIYKQESPFRARVIGAALVAKHAAEHIETYFLTKPGEYCPLVYCWRGGMRSGSLVTILNQMGWRAETLAGGYRTYRRAVVATLYDEHGTSGTWGGKMVLLDGNTGTAKTDLLYRLDALGVQTLDLEGIAHHRGSLFGGMGTDQPSQKAFESAIAEKWVGFDLSRPVVVEAESSKIGKLNLPEVLWTAMRAAPRLRIEADLAERASYIAETYFEIADDPSRLKATIEQLKPFLPAERITRWRELATSGDIVDLARELMEHRDDPAYARQRGRSKQVELGSLKLDGFSASDLDRAARTIAGIIEQASANG